MTETDLVTAGDSTENDKLSNSVTSGTSADPGASGSATDANLSGSDGSLSTMVLPELRALANRAGVKGTSGMRKNELIAAIRESPTASQRCAFQRRYRRRVTQPQDRDGQPHRSDRRRHGPR